MKINELTQMFTEIEAKRDDDKTTCQKVCEQLVDSFIKYEHFFVLSSDELAKAYELNTNLIGEIKKQAIKDLQKGEIFIFETNYQHSNPKNPFDCTRLYRSKNGSVEYNNEDYFKLIDYIWDLIVQNKIIIPEEDNYHAELREFLDSLRALSLMVLPHGNPKILHKLYDLPLESRLKKEYQYFESIVIIIINIALLSYDYSYAYEKYIKFVSSFQLKSFPQFLIQSMKAHIPENMRHKKPGPSYEKRINLAYKMMIDGLGKQELKFLYNLKSHVSEINETKDYELKVHNAVMLVKDLTEDLLKIGAILNEGDFKSEHTNFIMQDLYNTIKEFCDDQAMINFINYNLNDVVLSLSESLLNGNDIFEEDETEFLHLIKKRLAIIDDCLLRLREVYLFTKDPINIKKDYIHDRELFDTFVEKLRRFSMEYSRVIDPHYFFDISDDIRYIERLFAFINDLIIDKLQALFEEQLRSNGANIDVKKYCMRFLDYTENYASDPNGQHDSNELPNRILEGTWIAHLEGNDTKPNLDKFYCFIEKNERIVANLAFAQKILEEDNYRTHNGDYTAYIVGQIKTVERLLKEILVQFFPLEIYEIKNTIVPEHPIPFYRNELSNLTAGSLSGEPVTLLVNCRPQRNRKCRLDLGKAMYALGYILNENIPNYSGIFKGDLKPEQRQNPRPLRITFDMKDSDFYRKFISDEYGIRNGHFHIHNVDTHQLAVELSRHIAYWFLKVIDEMYKYFASETMYLTR